MDLTQRPGKQTPDTHWALDQNSDVCSALRVDFNTKVLFLGAVLAGLMF